MKERKSKGSRGSKAYKRDCADALQAHAFDLAAVRRLQAHAPAADALQAALDRRTRTRGPLVKALLRLSRQYPEAEAAGYLKQSDACYWAMVQRHEPMIRQQTFIVQRTMAWGTETDDLMSILKMGWYDAAVRFDPSRGTRYPTMAGRWGWARVQRERGKPGGIASSRHFASVSSIDEVCEDGTSIMETLTGEDGDLIGLLERQQARAILREEIAKLSERDQALIAAWLENGQTKEVTLRFDISRARMWQIINRLIDSTRARMP